MIDTLKCPLGKVGILGAGGFVGSRLVEVFHLTGLADVIPIVRRVASLARSSRFDLPVGLADTRDAEALSHVLVGCTSIVDCTVGMPAQIVAAARALIPAACAAGVRRVVYLSSASVHGQNPLPGSDETSPLSTHQEIAYNNAKVLAERRLFADAKRHNIELFVLRPSIVFGPRDRWLSTLAQELRFRTAWLIEEGQGICNTIYVDNLIEAIRCCLLAPVSAAGQPYLVGDAEPITWHILYENTAAMLQIEFSTVHQLALPPAPLRSPVDWLNAVRVLPSSQRVIAAVPSRLKGVVKGALSGLKAQTLVNPWSLPPTQLIPNPSREMVLLQQCRHCFENKNAAKEIGYQPKIPFQEGLQRTIDWQKWAGLC